MKTKIEKIFFEEKKYYQAIFGFVCISSLLVLLFNVLFSPNRLIYDEYFFCKNIIYLKDVSFFEFLQTYKLQPPGPLYQIIHYYTFTFSNNIVYVRIENLILALSNIYILSIILKRSNVKNYLFISLLYICIPLAWLNSGLALSETPTIFFSLLFFLFLNDVFERKEKKLFNIILCSIFLSCSIMGRSTFLVQEFALLILFFYKWFFSSRKEYAILYIIK